MTEGSIVKLVDSPDLWVVVAIEKELVTVHYQEMEAYQLDVHPDEIDEVVEE